MNNCIFTALSLALSLMVQPFVSNETVTFQGDGKGIEYQLRKLQGSAPPEIAKNYCGNFFISPPVDPDKPVQAKRSIALFFQWGEGQISAAARETTPPWKFYYETALRSMFDRDQLVIILDESKKIPTAQIDTSSSSRQKIIIRISEAEYKASPCLPPPKP